MLAVNDGNGKKVSLWGALGQIALACGASYGMSKISNKETGWTAYRDQMIAGMASTAMTFVAQQAATVQEQQGAAEQTTETVAQ